MTDIDLILSPRIEDLPVPLVPSAEVPCTECGEPCWRSYSIAFDLPGVGAICNRCVMAIAPEPDVFVLPEDRAEMLRLREKNR